MHVREDHGVCVARGQTCGGELPRELLILCHLEPGEGNVIDAGRLTRVDKEQAVFVLYRPAMDRHRGTPVAGEKQAGLSAPALAREEE